MSPQIKGTLRPADEQRIHKAVEIRALAELELVASVLDAMRHGGSISQTAAAANLSERTVTRWRRGQGLPTHEDWARPAREARERLYEAYPGLQEVQRMLAEMKADKPADS